MAQIPGLSWNMTQDQPENELETNLRNALGMAQKYGDRLDQPLPEYRKMPEFEMPAEDHPKIRMALRGLLYGMGANNPDLMPFVAMDQKNQDERYNRAFAEHRQLREDMGREDELSMRRDQQERDSARIRAALAKEVVDLGRVDEDVAYQDEKRGWERSDNEQLPVPAHLAKYFGGAKTATRAELNAASKDVVDFGQQRALEEIRQSGENASILRAETAAKAASLKEAWRVAGENRKRRISTKDTLNRRSTELAASRFLGSPGNAVLAQEFKDAQLADASLTPQKFLSARGAKYSPSDEDRFSAYGEMREAYGGDIPQYADLYGDSSNSDEVARLAASQIEPGVPLDEKTRAQLVMLGLSMHFTRQEVDAGIAAAEAAAMGATGQPAAQAAGPEMGPPQAGPPPSWKRLIPQAGNSKAPRSPHFTNGASSIFSATPDR